ncbi:MAG: class I mannose-6-phosphate isomerase [Alphaproteobacteria bacterium]|nr:class I mannose-6-phosphate isomerase [Alphaproteobacteria bacterium]
MKLEARQVEKPWGRTRLPPPFGDTGGRRIGEIWFEGPADLPLLAKYIFTGEKLSVQVHPDDAAARARGLPRGKSECWYILDAEPDAAIGLGLSAETPREALRAAAADGSIEGLMDWVPVAAGDFFFVPAGTIHAIGAGIALLEFQQASDVTYRLYDYGRPRALHLDDAVAVAAAGPYVRRPDPRPPSLVESPPFSLLRATEAPVPLEDRRRWVLPVEGEARAGGETAGPGECLVVAPGVPLDLGAGAVAFVGAE